MSKEKEIAFGMDEDIQRRSLTSFDAVDQIHENGLS